MPEMKLPRNFDENPIIAFDTAFKILSYMTHPSDASARETYVKASNQQIFTRLKNSISNDKVFEGIHPRIFTAAREATINENLKPNLTLPVNAEEFLVNINAKEVIRQFISRPVQKNWKTVGAIIHTLLKMKEHGGNLRGGASLKKATYFLERSIKYDQELAPHIYTNDTDMKKAWGAYKSVAHFMLPFYKMYSDPNTPFNTNIFTQVGLRNFLGLSASIQARLLDLAPSHSEKSKLVEPDKLWTVPHHFQLSPIPVRVTEFNEMELQILSSYRSA